jgi:hypothetical protein
MSKKSKERRKDRDGGTPPPKGTAEALKRRRNRRFLFIGLIALAFPLLELIAYQFRAITVVLINRSDVLAKGVEVTYPGGSFEVPELKPGGSVTRVIRPDYTFKGEHFSTYSTTVRFATDDGGFFRQLGRAGALDYSATERYEITRTPVENRIQLQHTTRPGFPLSLARDLMDRLGFG